MGGSVSGGVFRVTTFGESHGPAVGCVVDGCPAGVPLAAEDIARDLRRRRPGSPLPGSSARAEADDPEILSGVFEGKTLGTPIAIVIRNTGHHSADYDGLKDLYRPGHADWTWEAKYGFRDHRGGGRSSGRETAGRVAAGAVAKAFLASQGADGAGVSVTAWVSRAAGIDIGEPEDTAAAEVPAAVRERLEKLAAEGDSAGGIITCRIRGLPPGLGEPVFGKIAARLGTAALSIGACKGVEFGAGFAAADMAGSACNDAPLAAPGATPGGQGGAAPGAFKTNNAGGSLGGISTGMDLAFRAAFKPPASIRRPQATVDRSGARRELAVEGRHDVCVVFRAVPVVEAMAALVVADLMLLQRCARV